MKVTGIRPQVKTPGRFSVFVDEKYTFSLSDTALLESKLQLGQSLSVERIKELKQISADDALYGLALRYIALRPRSEWEMRMYLQRKHASPALTKDMLNRLSNSGFLDDRAFAEAWVGSRRLLRPVSKRKLQQELRVKRVSDEVIEQVLAADSADEQQLLRELALKKRSRYTDDIKLMQYLVRQGFNYQDVKSVVSEL